MIRNFVVIVAIVLPMLAFCQQDSVLGTKPNVLDLPSLIVEALSNNPEIKAEAGNMDVMQARIPQAGSLEDPELMFVQDMMPHFAFSEAMYSRIGLSQTIPFPLKLGIRKELARIQADHAHHDHLEKINEVLAILKSTYYELWFVQQSIILNQENARLVDQFLTVARTEYGVGKATQQDILKGQVELSMIGNESITLRQEEMSAKAMLLAILNRSPGDTVGLAVVPEEVMFDINLDSLTNRAMKNRPMLAHDSSVLVEQQTNLSLSQKEYYPDFKFGLEHVTSPLTGFNGWSVTAGITIPVAPWTLGRTNARIEEATASVEKAQSTLTARRNDVINNVKDLYYKAEAGKQQLDTYRTAILPQARQSLDASLVSYQTGQTDFLMLIDSYRTWVSLMKEHLATRLQFERNIASLEREAGIQFLSSLR